MKMETNVWDKKNAVLRGEFTGIKAYTTGGKTI